MVLKTISAIVIFWSIGKFIIGPLQIKGSLDSPGMITVIICATIVLCCVAIALICKDKY